jgi:hypothetical protein
MELVRSAAIAVTISILSVIPFRLSIGIPPAGSSGTDTWSALWIGGDSGVVKLSASDGALLRRLSGVKDVRSIAVDNFYVSEPWNHYSSGLPYQEKTIIFLTFLYFCIAFRTRTRVYETHIRK